MAECRNARYTIRYATEHDVPVILQLIQELAIYEKALHEVRATEEKLFQTLSFPTSSDSKIRAKPGTAKTLLLISYESAVNGASSPAAQVSAALETESSDNATFEEGPGQVAGMALFFNNYSTWLAQPGIYLEDLFVRPQYRKKGYGKALFQALARECLEKDYGRLEWQVLRWNQPSIDFYRAIGAGSQGDEWDYMRLTGDALSELASRP